MYLYFMVLFECSLLLYLSIYLCSCVVYIRWFISKIQTPEWVTFTKYKNRFYCLFKGFILSVGMNYLIWGFGIYAFHFLCNIQKFYRIDISFTMAAFLLLELFFDWHCIQLISGLWVVHNIKIHRDKFCFVRWLKIVHTKNNFQLEQFCEIK